MTAIGELRCELGAKRLVMLYQGSKVCSWGVQPLFGGWPVSPSPAGGLAARRRHFTSLNSFRSRSKHRLLLHLHGTRQQLLRSLALVNWKPVKVRGWS